MECVAASGRINACGVIVDAIIVCCLLLPHRIVEIFSRRLQCESESPLLLVRACTKMDRHTTITQLYALITALAVLSRVL